MRFFYNATRDAQKVVLVDMGFLGDTLHLIPALWEVRRHYPNAEIHVLTSPVGEEVLGLVPGLVDRTWVVRWASGSGMGTRAALRAAYQLWREPFDAAINFSGVDRTLFFTALTGAPWRVATPGGRKHFWNRWLIPHWIARPDPTLPVFEQKRQMLAACGMALEPVRWDLSMKPETARRAESLVPLGALHFSINASTSLKEWPVEHWIALAVKLLAVHPQLQIVASGSASVREQAQLRRLQEGVNHPRLMVLPAGLTITDLAAVLQRCQMHVGSDSGVLHLAVAMGIPTLSFFRENEGAVAWMPSGPGHRVIRLGCECVNQPSQPCAASGRPRCLAGLEVEAVEQAILSLQLPS